jgi:phage terminase small subunit
MPTKRKDWVPKSDDVIKKLNQEKLKKGREKLNPNNEEKMALARERHQLFAAEYVKDMDHVRAAKAVGYGPTHGGRLMQDEFVLKCIAEEMLHRAERLQLDQNWVIGHLVELVERCMQKTPVIRWDYDVKGMAQAKDEDGNHIWSFDSRGANKALELLGRHLRMFTDKLEIGDAGDPMEKINRARERANAGREPSAKQCDNEKPNHIEFPEPKQAQHA